MYRDKKRSFYDSYAWDESNYSSSSSEDESNYSSSSSEDESVFQSSFSNAQKAHEQFFRVGQRLKVSGRAKNLTTEIRSMRRADSSPNSEVDITGLSSRTCVLGLTRALQADLPALTSTNFDQLAIKWRLTDNEQYPFAADCFKKGTTRFKRYPIPTPSQPGNFFLEGAGSYENSGFSTSMLYVINKFTQCNKRLEQALAKALQDASCQGVEITADFLRNYGTFFNSTHEYYPKDIERLNSINFLRSVGEVERRLYVDAQGELAHDIDDCPISVAQALALELVIVGKLRMADLFEFDAEYGVSTSRNITADSDILDYKIESLLIKYTEYLNQRSELRANLYKDKQNLLTIRCEHFHDLLIKHFGGAYESSGDEYSDDEESLPSRKRYY